MTFPPAVIRLALLALFLAATVHAARKPDVLFIAIDDMNDGVTLFGEDRPFRTPNLRKLAERGVFFSRAYCSSPACNPSRASVLTGKRPHQTGVYGNRTNWRKACRQIATLPEYFRKRGYRAEGFGKIYHHHGNGAFNDPAAWDNFRKMDPQYMPPAKLNGAGEYGSRNTDWGPWPSNEEEARTIDFKSVSYAVEALARKGENEKPLFLACGIFKPHSPFFAPPKYHELYEKGVPMPVLNENDWDDLPAGAAKLMRSKKWFWRGMENLERRRPGSYANFVKAYAACCSFSDASVGRLIEALDRSGRAGNTIVVLWSDHGFHLGEKEHVEKFALWEKATHVPLLIVDPRQPESAGKVCPSPVDLTCLYPTLLELCGLPSNPDNDGIGVAAQVKNPDLPIGRPALTTYGFGNHAIRSERWRYVRYADGTEELYDHAADPHEWNNLATQPKYRPIIREHEKWLPKTNAKPFGNLR